MTVDPEVAGSSPVILVYPVRVYDKSSHLSYRRASSAPQSLDAFAIANPRNQIVILSSFWSGKTSEVDWQGN